MIRSSSRCRRLLLTRFFQFVYEGGDLLGVGSRYASGQPFGSLALIRASSLYRLFAFTASLHVALLAVTAGLNPMQILGFAP